MSQQKNNSISRQYLKECLDYNHKTGLLNWKTRPLNHFNSSNKLSQSEKAELWNGRFSGKQAGSSKHKSNRYTRVCINGQSYPAHRIIWLIVYGSWPEHEIDHIDHNRKNNRIDNLRDITATENQRNQSLHKNNKSGVTGVSWAADRHVWRAYIKLNKKNKNLGSHKHFNDAVIARKMAEYEHGFHVNHGAYQSILPTYQSIIEEDKLDRPQFPQDDQ